MRLTVYPLAVALTVAGCSQNRPAQGSAPFENGPPPAALQSPAPAAQPVGSEATRADVSAPQIRELEIPAGTTMLVTLSTPVASDTSRVEDMVRGRVASAIVVNGATAVPSNSEVIGTVRNVERSGRVKGRAVIAFQFERLIVRGEALAIRSATVTREAAANRGEDVKKAAIGGAAGAIVGGLFKGGKGAVVGAGIGGTGAVLATRGEEVRLSAGTTVRATLRQPLKVMVRSAQ